MPRYTSLAERLLANSRTEHCGFVLDGRPSECWLWIGNADHHGYGRITRRIDGKHKKVRAHRASYGEFIGPIPADHTLDHLCRMTGCIHPNHVEPCPADENSRRMQVARRALKAIATNQET